MTEPIIYNFKHEGRDGFPIHPKSTPKIRAHAIDLFHLMMQTAVNTPGGLGEKPIVTWEGSVAALFRDLGISQGYHTPIIRLLTETECIRQSRRGARNIKSAYVLMRDARRIKPEDWPTGYAIQQREGKNLTYPATAGKLLEQRVDNITESLSGLNVALALGELGQEVKFLNKRIKELENTISSITVAVTKD